MRGYHRYDNDKVLLKSPFGVVIAIYWGKTCWFGVEESYVERLVRLFWHAHIVEFELLGFATVFLLFLSLDGMFLGIDDVMRLSDFSGILFSGWQFKIFCFVWGNYDLW